MDKENWQVSDERSCGFISSIRSWVYELIAVAWLFGLYYLHLNY